MTHCTGYGNCKQGRAQCKTEWACNVKTTDGGESVDNGLPVQMDEDRPSMLANRLFWLSAIACGLLYAGAYALLSYLKG